MNCPRCAKPVTESDGSPVSPYLNTYRCECGWAALRCGDTACDGYMTAEPTSSPGTWRYTCATCGWTGTGVPFAAVAAF